MAGGDEGCRLYLITPPALEPRAFADTLARALDAGDVAALQLRLKAVEEDALRRAIDLLLPVAQSRGVAFLLNDRADLAVRHGCDGAHLGQEDGDHAAARKLLGPDRTLGITCHGSRHLAMEAGEAGADYVAFGAFFPTATKQAEHSATPDVLEWWTEMFELPAVAIGGINAENCAPLVRAGADFLAVVGAVWNHPEGPEAGVRAMNAAIAAA
ncbi:thiamine phosphate synthase [Teichococcus vastitatis]|jgi:thiamine-phosphate pyrophosphorylase|uniref:Thiamine-phosphate synthase n=1 Tax=Teichococcus vastitatis TaxID=2307076 RepID=A0ABS9W435_9PROT|nr:thiamine phosphate synthase [Pseudoroseomonas vastitatis]MCI0754047.1 thiamine phosphate synthase [Pseudoroseomonas vastitatis]